MAQILLRDYFQETEDAIAAGKYADALAHCQHILSQFPETLEVQRLLGEVYLAQGQLEEAQHTFDWILTNDPENVVVYCDRALVSERMSDLDTALDCYQQAYELSRGNSQIRQEFNKLSTRAGQQGFMFSRAGLARLYMRGDLLSQALQEWEAVLTVSPDRLDARTGLLETYWREGLYEHVEQLATQILQDVPGCLKALLLLAFVVATKDMYRAQELLQRAETMDPELLMAHEIFADMIASQPGNPFFKLLQREPVLLTDEPEPFLPGQHGAAVSQVATQQQRTNWDALEKVAGVQPHVEPEQILETASFGPASWSSSNAVQADPWEMLSKDPYVESSVPQLAEQPQDAHVADPWAMLENAATGQSKQDYVPDSWQLAQEAPAHSQEHSSAYQDAVAEPQWADNALLDEDATWSSQGKNGSGDYNSAASSLWTASDAERAETSAPPSWLSMLTQTDNQQSNDAPPTFSSQREQEEKTYAEPMHQLDQVDQFAQEPVASGFEYRSYSEREQPKSPFESLEEDDEEAFSFGPAWLKSLGAASMHGFSDDATPSTPPLASPVYEGAEPEAVLELSERQAAESVSSSFDVWQLQAPEPQHMPDEWQSQLAELQPTDISWQSHLQGIEAANSTWQQPLVAAQPTFETWNSLTASADEEAQDVITTLEDLEHDLRSQGFVPLEPNSLSVIAQSQEAVPEASEAAKEPMVVQSEEADLSSALAQLGNLPSQETPAVAPSAPVQIPVEPMWATSLRAVPAPAPVPQESQVPQMPSVPERRNIPPTYTPAAASVPQPARPQEAPAQQPVRIDAFPGPIFYPAPEPVKPFTPVQEPLKVPVARSDALLDAELETTMKRPAVRLQAMQSSRPVAASQELASRGRVGNTAGVGKQSEASATSTNYRERLVKGYQHQLVGDYDEAMQEYRVIIRNAPELLGEVVSNVRALLKIAPKYAAGYRVLGDAYMRQGEYLQAMEAYNKALTMAKKAKA